MPKTYTFNQTMAIACAFALSMWGLTAHAVSRMQGVIVPLYTVLVIVVWILVPLYIMLIRHAFIAGIFTIVLVMCYLAILPTVMHAIEWYTFARGLMDFTYIIIYIIGFAFIYFAYKSYRELLSGT